MYFKFKPTQKTKFINALGIFYIIKKSWRSCLSNNCILEQNQLVCECASIHYCVPYTVHTTYTKYNVKYVNNSTLIRTSL